MSFWLIRRGADGLAQNRPYTNQISGYLAVLPKDFGTFLAIAFQPGDALVAIGSDISGADALTFWNTRDWTQNSTLTGNPIRLPVSSLAFSPDGKLLAIGDGAGRIYVLNPSTGQSVRVLAARSIPLYTGFAENGKELYVVTSDGTILNWALPDWSFSYINRDFQIYATLTPMIPIAARPLVVRDLNILDLAFGEGNNVTLLQDAHGGLPVSLRTHKQPIAALAFGDGLLASASFDNTVALWETETLRGFRYKDVKPLQKLNRFNGSVTSLTFSRDGKTLAIGTSLGSIELRDAATWKMRRTFQAHTGPVWRIVFSMSGNVLMTSGEDKKIRVWKTE